jgi:YD repeat-containing protein
LTALQPCGCGATNYYDDITGTLIANSDALGNVTSNFYDATTSLLSGTRDPLGNITTNVYDSSANLIATSLLQGPGSADVPSGTILTTIALFMTTTGIKSRALSGEG